MEFFPSDFFQFLPIGLPLRDHGTACASALAACCLLLVYRPGIGLLPLLGSRGEMLERRGVGLAAAGVSDSASKLSWDAGIRLVRGTILETGLSGVLTGFSLK